MQTEQQYVGMLWIWNYFFSDLYPDPIFQEIPEPDLTCILTQDQRLNLKTKIEHKF